MEDICWSDYLNDTFDHEDPSLRGNEGFNTPSHCVLRFENGDRELHPKHTPTFDYSSEAVYHDEEWDFDSHDPPNFLEEANYFISSEPHFELEGCSVPATNTVWGMPSNKKAPDSRIPKTRRAHQADICLTVRAWLRLHAEDPYPTTEEKEEFAKSWNFSLKQVSCLFNNERRRSQWRRSPASHSIPSSQSPLTASSIGATDFSTGQRPLDRYLSSSSDEDPQSSDLVARAVASFDHDSPTGKCRNGSRQIHKGQHIGTLEDDKTAEISSVCDISSSNGSSDQVSSTGSSYKSGKRGKRKVTIVWRPTPNKGRFYCTYCWKNFTLEASWRKHEETVHKAKMEFECRMAELVPSLQNCGACVNSQLGCRLSLRHNYRGCQNRSKEARTFNRKDHFRNHLKLSHDADFTSMMHAWVQFDRDRQSLCGYCHRWFLTWSERLDHISDHYRSNNGFDRSKWQLNCYDEFDQDADQERGLVDKPENDENQERLVLVPRREQLHLKNETASFLDKYLGQKAAKTHFGSSMFFQSWQEDCKMLDDCRPQRSPSDAGTDNVPLSKNSESFSCSDDNFSKSGEQSSSIYSHLVLDLLRHVGSWI